MNTYKLSRKKVRLLKKQKLQILMMVIYPEKFMHCNEEATR